MRVTELKIKKKTSALIENSGIIQCKMVCDHMAGDRDQMVAIDMTQKQKKDVGVQGGQ